MFTCNDCKKCKVCKWKNEATEILMTKLDVKLNPDSPFSVVLYCAEFEKDGVVF